MAHETPENREPITRKLAKVLPKPRLGLQDLVELAIGSCIMAFPVAVTEEVWNLSESLTSLRALYVFTGSLFFVGLFNYSIHYKRNIQGRRLDFVRRVAVSYLDTLIICGLILAAIGKLPLVDETAVAFRRTLLVAFPACFSATVVDSLR